jgi:hypothetical protein
MNFGLIGTSSDMRGDGGVAGGAPSALEAWEAAGSMGKPAGSAKSLSGVEREIAGVTGAESGAGVQGALETEVTGIAGVADEVGM